MVTAMGITGIAALTAITVLMGITVPAISASGTVEATMAADLESISGFDLPSNYGDAIDGRLLSAVFICRVGLSLIIHLIVAWGNEPQMNTDERG